jgi:hypothetical protein
MTWEPILAWAGLVLLALFCLPIGALRKFVLELTALVLRLALLAVLVAGGLLWFRPEQLPVEVSSFVGSTPWLARILPAPGDPLFGPALACLIVGPLLPSLALLDVTRKLAGRTRRLRDLADAYAAVDRDAAGRPVLDVLPVNPPHRVDRRSAAEKMAEASSGKPFRVSDHV